jgi:hypothetical protein
MEGSDRTDGNDDYQPMVGTATGGTEIANWFSILESNGWAGKNRTEPIGLGILTVTGHHYLRVPSIGAGDPTFFVIEKGSVVDGVFAIPAIPLSIVFESDEALAKFAEAYASAWEKEGEVKEVTKGRLEAALRDSLAGEERLLSLKIDEIAEALAWVHQRDPSGLLFRRCFRREPARGARV